MWCKFCVGHCGIMAFDGDKLFEHPCRERNFDLTLGLKWSSFLGYLSPRALSCLKAYQTILD